MGDGKELRDDAWKSDSWAKELGLKRIALLESTFDVHSLPVTVGRKKLKCLAVNRFGNVLKVMGHAVTKKVISEWMLVG